jgi:glycosyltransferase involved in cell wall biosynthesis
MAICAMPAPLDLMMAAALHRAGVPMIVVVHDADRHPGDGFPGQMLLQRALIRQADAIVALSSHVARSLAAQDLVGVGAAPLLRCVHPPLAFGAHPPPIGAHGGPRRLLLFGRLLPYKGLGLLAEAWRQLGPAPSAELRVVGLGPESAALRALRGLPCVTVENQWVPEAHVGALLAWADALVLSHTEASQSGVAAAAAAAGRLVLATRVGGLAEQLADMPGALLCDPEPGQLASGLRQLMRAPAAVTNGVVDTQLAWRDAAAGLLAQTEKVLRSRPATTPSIRTVSTLLARPFPSPAAEIAAD